MKMSLGNEVFLEVEITSTSRDSVSAVMRLVNNAGKVTVMSLEQYKGKVRFMRHKCMDKVTRTMGACRYTDQYWPMISNERRKDEG